MTLSHEEQLLKRAYNKKEKEWLSTKVEKKYSNKKMRKKFMLYDE